jgi:hypothetical protein
MTREGKDTPLAMEKRIQKSKEVKITFIDPECFNITDESGNVKYYGKVSEHKTNDEYSCPSWYYGMQFEKASDETLKGESRYVAENGFNFLCKHLISARKTRYSEVIV